MYTLFYAPGSASMVVHLALLEIGAPYRLERVDLAAGAQRDPNYLKLNPQGVVPTLVIDGKPVTESAALLMALADRHPEARLAPLPGSAERDRWYQWNVFLSNTLASSYRFWFYPPDLGSTEHSPEVREAIQRKIEGACPKAETAAMVVAEAAAWAMNQAEPVESWLARLPSFSRDEEWKTICKKLTRALAAQISVAEFADSLGLPRGVTGYAYHSVPVALYASQRHAGNFRQALEAALNCGGDTDI